MGVEIERKFLVHKAKWEQLQKPVGKLFRQGYISTDAAKTVRVRTGDGKGYLTLKGANVGLTRLEFEYEIPIADAEQLLKNFCSNSISKTRYEIWLEGKLWEVDVFHDANERLLIAEIELAIEDESFALPDWIEKELSEDERYYNSNLSLLPYKNRGAS